MIIYAISIHTGGGKVLLDEIIKNNIFGETSYLFCDSRYEIPGYINPKTQIIKVKPTLSSRWFAEYKLKSIASKESNEDILCFSNLPPFFKLKNKVILYLQNALLLPQVSIANFSLKVFFRLGYEKIWLKLFLKNCDEAWVQTQFMKKMLTKIFPCEHIFIRPIIPQLPSPTIQAKKYDFISVTSPDSHKRLSDVITLWNSLTLPRPILLIVSSPLPKNLIEQIKIITDNKIILKTNLKYDEIFRLYEESKCLLVSSKFESFCLPLYEGKHFGLKLFAPKEEYVLESFSPDIIFNSENMNQTKIDLQNFLSRL